MSPCVRTALVTFALSGALVPSRATAQAPNNFPNARAYVVNVCPSILLSNFSYLNQSDARGASEKFHQNLSWKNIGSQPLVAFEVVILKYDAFNRRMAATSWTVTGHNSANWRPLTAGTTDGDSTLSDGYEEVFTAVAYVRAARHVDGTVWRVNESDVLRGLRALNTGITDFGDVRPDSLPSHRRLP